MTRPAPDAPIETRWEGRFITVRQQGTWEYVSRSRGIHAAVILAIDDAADGRHVILVEQYRVPLKRNRSEEHTSELQSLMRRSYAVFCLKKKKQTKKTTTKAVFHMNKKISIVNKSQSKHKHKVSYRNE